MELDRYDLILTVIGLAILGVVLLPRILADRPLSYPIIYVLSGAALMILPVGWPSPDPSLHTDVTERLAELGVIVALTGAGLKLNRRIGLRSWQTTWRLLLVSMPLTIAAVALLGMWLLDLSAAGAVLLGAALAPTDPVLAADVQVEEPATVEDPDGDHEVRFALTSEAGLNDGLAFPFVNAAIALAIVGSDVGDWAVEWVLIDLLYRVACGVVIGYVIGRGLGHMIFERPSSGPLADTSEGMVVLATTLVVYGVAELLGGYGFLAVFVSAVVIRDRERDHEYHQVMHTFSDQAERLLSAIILLALGSAVARGLLSEVGVPAVACALLLIFVVRPLFGMVGQLGCDSTTAEKGAISFFGIRGIGSIYYLAHGLNEAPFGAEGEILWSVVALVILVSIGVHGVTATPLVRRATGTT